MPTPTGPTHPSATMPPLCGPNLPSATMPTPSGPTRPSATIPPPSDSTPHPPGIAHDPSVSVQGTFRDMSISDRDA